MDKIARIRSVRPQTGFVVVLELTDGTTKSVDLTRYLRGSVFDPIRSDQAMFERVAVDQRAGTITWPNGADIDPDVLCLGLPPAWESQPQAATAKN